MSKLKIESLDNLVSIIREVFQDDVVNIHQVIQFLMAYKSKPKDWRKYAFFDRLRYTRNLVDSGNDKYNMILLCWSEGQESSIHDHANSHCFYKVLSGTINETLFKKPDESEVSSDGEVHEMKVVKEAKYKCDDVNYINDSIGLHRVENSSHTEPAVSLHIYIPPITTCHVFDQRTGRSLVTKCTFYSQQGKRIPYRVSENNGSLNFEINNEYFSSN